VRPTPASTPVVPAAGSVPTAPPVGAWVSTRPTPTEFLPPGHRGERGWHLTQSAVLITIFGLVLAVVAAAIAVLAFEGLSSRVAIAIVAVMVVVGLAASAKRVPAALWWTMGAVIGGALGHWS
jgi:hypothetical protein